MSPPVGLSGAGNSGPLFDAPPGASLNCGVGVGFKPAFPRRPARHQGDSNPLFPAQTRRTPRKGIFLPRFSPPNPANLPRIWRVSNACPQYPQGKKIFRLRRNLPPKPSVFFNFWWTVAWTVPSIPSDFFHFWWAIGWLVYSQYPQFFQF